MSNTTTPTSNTNHTAKPADDTFYNANAELADLGQARYDHDTAAYGDRDHALHHGATPLAIPQRRPPPNMDATVFAWKTFQYETADRNTREELKGDLHGGQLHRQNRAARGELEPVEMVERARRNGAKGGRGERGGGGIRGGKGRAVEDGLVAGRKPDYDCPPLAKGFAEELSADLFWSGPIV